MAALYFTWTGWTQGSPDSQRATHFHWETHFLCMHLSHTGTLKTSANYTNTEGRLSKFDLNGIIHAGVCGTRALGCRGLDVRCLFNKETSIVASPGEQNRSSELWAAGLKGMIAFECHRRDKRRLSSSVQGSVSVLQHPYAHTPTL